MYPVEVLAVIKQFVIITLSVPCTRLPDGLNLSTPAHGLAQSIKGHWYHQPGSIDDSQDFRGPSNAVKWQW